ncbi:MAG: PTS sugar transporter subunit IIA [Deltaproteobacteria bacterium]|nr:PTS sugar transporter subunit IIA [Deltaproteobacteria bacterium]
MVGIVLVTHGKLGQEMLRTAEGIVGALEGTRAVSIEPQESMEQIREKLSQAIAEVDSGEGVLVLTDMFGGTPANLALTFLDERRVEVVTGVNLPMLLKLGTSRQDPATLGEIAHLVTTYGQKNIVLASELLGGTRREGARG